MSAYKLGDVVRLGGESILAGLGAVVLADDGDTVWVVSAPVGGADYPLRHVMPREDVEPYEPAS